MQIASLHLDTYRIVKHLEAKGYTEEQAKGFIEAVEQIDLVGVATKHDVQSSETRMQESISTLRIETQNSISTLRKEMAQTRGEIYKAMFYQSFAIVGLTVTLLKFLG